MKNVMQNQVIQNKLAKLAQVTAIAVFAPMAVASTGMEVRDPYVGLEFIQTNQNYKAGFGKDVFKKNVQNYAAFLGLKFASNFGAEAGIEVSPKRSRNNVYLGVGQSIPGGTVNIAGESAIISSTIKATHPYLGLFGEYKTCYATLQLLVAASVSHFNATTHTTQFDGGAVNIFANYSKTKVIPMVKLSATHYFTENVGVRISANYKNTSQVKQTVANGTIKLKDTWGAGIGVTYAFM